MPLLKRKEILLAAVEGTPGTAETLDAGDGAFNIYNPVLTPEVPSDQRPGATGFAQHKAVPGARSARLTFETDLIGAATVPGWGSTFLVSCGMTLSSRTYSFATTSSTLTMGLYIDGLRQGLLVGAVGTFTIPLVAGKYPRVQFEYLGKWSTDSDVALPAPTFPTTVPPRWAGNAVTLASVTPLVANASITAGNELYLREDATDVTGHIAGHIVDRVPMIELDPEAVVVATKDWQSLMFASTENAFSIAIGTAADNICTIAGSGGQVVETPLGERGKIATRQLKLQCNGVSPFTVTFS